MCVVRRRKTAPPSDGERGRNDRQLVYLLIEDEGLFPRPPEFLPGDSHPFGWLQGRSDDPREEFRHRHTPKLRLVVEPLDEVRMHLRLIRSRMWHGFVAELSPRPATHRDERANVRSILYNTEEPGIAREPLSTKAAIG
jgi:hypothetical protein